MAGLKLLKRRLEDWLGQLVHQAIAQVGNRALPAVGSALRPSDLAPAPAWYAGMVVDPTDFAEQLMALQGALGRGGAPPRPSQSVRGQSVESAVEAVPEAVDRGARVTKLVG